jgi:hypothetical protein
MENFLVNKEYVLWKIGTATPSILDITVLYSLELDFLAAFTR